MHGENGDQHSTQTTKHRPSLFPPAHYFNFKKQLVFISAEHRKLEHVKQVNRKTKTIEMWSQVCHFYAKFKWTKNANAAVWKINSIAKHHQVPTQLQKRNFLTFLTTSLNILQRSQMDKYIFLVWGDRLGDGLMMTAVSQKLYSWSFFITE